MNENDELKKIIRDMVDAEINAIEKEINDIVAEAVRSKIIPALRAAIRKSIARELSATISELHGKQLNRTVFNIRDEKLSANSSSIESDVHSVAEAKFGEPSCDHGLYLYGLAPTDVSISLGNVGIDGCEVYTIPHEGISAIVHKCPLEPYKSDDDETVKRWIKTHQTVLDLASDRFGTVMPFGFDTIISPKDNLSAEDVLEKWISAELDEIKRKLKRIEGRKEYGIQVFYNPFAFVDKIERDSAEVRKIKEEIASKPPGMAYMYRQKLEIAVKRELDAIIDGYFKEFYDKIRRNVDDIKVEKLKKSEDSSVMMLNLSVLASDEKVLGQALDEIESVEGFSVRFTGPWQPYSFV